MFWEVDIRISMTTKQFAYNESGVYTEDRLVAGFELAIDLLRVLAVFVVDDIGGQFRVCHIKSKHTGNARGRKDGCIVVSMVARAPGTSSLPSQPV